MIAYHRPPLRIVLIVTGGIAAYKIATLARLLKKNGDSVRVVMSKNASAFISPLTFQALTGNAVHSELLDETAELGMGHIELAKWAQLVLIAPMTANSIARLAGGFADELWAALCLATVAPVLLAPAMNQQMWHHPLLQKNLHMLQQAGYIMIPPAAGEQACGDVGAGRLPEAQELFDFMDEFLTAAQDHCNTPLMEKRTDKQADKLAGKKLAGKKVVITAGATLEPIDPVRFLSNHSTGKMGYALARACVALGATVVLVAGKAVAQPTPCGVEKITIITADDMLQACLQTCIDADMFIATAAVADFKMAAPAVKKIKKTADNALVLNLVKTPDILATVSDHFPNMLSIGFAAETHDAAANAQNKLRRKGIAMVACNDVSDPRIGFGSDDNALTLFFAERFARSPVSLPIASKEQIACQLLAEVLPLLPA